MHKKYLAMFLIILLFNFAGGRVVFAQTQDVEDAKLAAKIKTKVAKYGTGEKSKVSVGLRNQTKVKGYISAIDDDSFSVTDKKTGQTTKIAYVQVKKVNRPGLSTSAKIGIAVGIAVPVAIILTIFGIRYCNEQAC